MGSSSPVVVVPEWFGTVREQEVAIRAFLGDPGRVLDVGPGIRPTCRRWLVSRGWVGLEAFGPYVEKVRSDWPELDIRHVVVPPIPFGDAAFDIVVLDDVIEHFEKSEGRDVLDEALRVVRRGVVVRTPNGFHRQETDLWGLGGDRWQRHRSGWSVSDFPSATRVWHVTGHRAGPWMGLWIPKKENECDTSSRVA